MIFNTIFAETKIIEIMSEQEKREALFDWIKQMDEQGLDELIAEYLND